jgi:DNA-binding winged helix-turn-helix (wHTH) protein/TolB-like protein/Tfp pilus assembly protein PilF
MFPMGGKFQFSPFMFDADSGVLSRNGREVRIPQQTSLLLTLLLQRAGTVVTREDIQQILWADGEYLDHEHAIHRAVNNLRGALRDSAQNPKYIETFPKRGYSFRAAVNVVAGSGDKSPEPLIVDLALRLPTIDADKQEERAGESLELQLLPADIPPQAAQSPAHWLSEAKRKHLGQLFVACAALSFVVMGVLYIRAHHRIVPSRMISLGIAPIEAQDPHDEQLAESFRLDLMDTLSQLPNVQLLASHSLENFKQDDASIREISHAANLDLLLIGSLKPDGGKYVLQFELIRGSDGVHVASFQYVGAEDELATIRDKVQRDVFANLNVTRTSIQAIRGSTQVPQAYGYYLAARELAYRRTSESLPVALQQYKLAIDRDPSFAKAYAGLASAYLANFDYTGLPEDQRNAEVAANQALKLDPDLAEAHASIGLIAFLRDWDFVSAERELRRAIDLEPHQAANHAWLAQLLVIESRFDESLHQIDLAKADDPLWPQVYNIETLVAGGARSYDRAMQAAKRYEELLPGSPAARDGIAWADFSLGRYEDAIAEWRIMASIEKDEWRVALEDRGLQAFRQGGPVAYANVHIQAAITQPNKTASHSNDFVLAEWEAFAGNRSVAMGELEKEVAHHDDDAIDIAINPMFDSLHSDPRYINLVTRIGLKLPVAGPPVEPRQNEFAAKSLSQ